MERISTESVIVDMFNNERSTNNWTDLSINLDHKSKYNLVKGYGKEYLGQSLLMALAFLRLCVIRCPDSLATLNKRSGK